MDGDAPSEMSTALFKGGPTLIDVLVDVAELRVTVTGPRMLFEKLQLLTTLSAFDGCTVQRLRDLAGQLEGTIHCGLVGIQAAEIAVVPVRFGGLLEIGLGPPSMYQSELVLRTKTGESFRALIRRHLSDDPAKPFFAGLHAVAATGHLERHGAFSGGGGAQDDSEHPAPHGGSVHGHP